MLRKVAGHMPGKIPRCSAIRLTSSLSLATWERAAQLPGVLNLAVGQPAHGLLPSTSVQQAALRLSEFDARHLLQYGSPAGSVHYLEAVGSFLSAELGYTVDSSNLFATPGNSGGLALVTRTLTRPGDTVLMEEPSYFLAHQVFRDYKCNFLQIHHRADGAGTLDIDALAALLWRVRYLSTTTADMVMPQLLYCVPTGNNPTGRTMPDADRARLVQLCAEYGVTIIADDVYEMLQWCGAGEGSEPMPLRWHAQQQGLGATVISLGSWSKILGPGLRLGWVEAEPELLKSLSCDGEVESFIHHFHSPSLALPRLPCNV